MTLIELFKAELGQRNLTRFFPSDSQQLDAILTSYLDDGREVLAKRKPIVRAVDVPISTVTEVALPETMLWPKKLWLNGSELTEMANYPHDKSQDLSINYSPFEPIVGPLPDSNNYDQYGDWRFDLFRKVIVFNESKSGTLTVGGFGIPSAETLSVSERGSVLLWALWKAYDGIIMKLIAKPDLVIPGFSISQHLVEMQAEAKRLLDAFNETENRAYGVVTRT